MKPGISASAAPDASVAELAELCVRRGWSALEITPAHIGEAAALGPLHVAVLVDDVATIDAAATAAGLQWIIGGAATLRERIMAGLRLRDRGSAVAVLLRGASAADVDRVRAAALTVAWEIGPTDDNVADAARAVLETPGVLAYVRLVGGGAEAVMHEGRGIGAIMARLALARYDGPVIMTPSSTRYRVVWQQWLQRRSHGCGSQADPRSGMSVLHSNGEVQRAHA